MKKQKGNEIIKVAMAAVLSIGLFSAAFIGANNFALAAATGKTESIPSAAATVNIPATATVTPEDYQKPELTVYIPENPWYTVNPNAISAEEAAELGALYIWDMFGESMDGKVVEMYYSAWESHTRAYWHGNVANTLDDLTHNGTTDSMPVSYNPVYSFTVCATSGERIDIDKKVSHAVGDDVSAALSALHNDRNRRDELVNLRSAQQPPEHLDEYYQAAKDFTAKHFVDTDIVSVVFRNASAVGFDLDENGKLFIAAQQLLFTVTDNTGREAEVSISRETKELLHIITQHNDVVPGYSYGTP